MKARSEVTILPQEGARSVKAAVLVLEAVFAMTWWRSGWVSDGGKSKVSRRSVRCGTEGLAIVSPLCEYRAISLLLGQDHVHLSLKPVALSFFLAVDRQPVRVGRHLGA